MDVRTTREKWIEIGSEIGPYRVESLIGSGGMAEVYKVWHRGLHRYEAMKVLMPGMTFERIHVERFLNEARMAARLRHSNIATIHSVSGADGPMFFYTMEIIDGNDLSGFLKERGRLPLEAALPILKQIAAALDYAHGEGVIHRDVKPGNILLRPDESGGTEVKVVDFGIARAQYEEGVTRLTKTGMIVGTPEYMSPEQAGSGGNVDHHTDIYSLGIISYELLAGKPPFCTGGGTSPISVIMMHIETEPPSLLENCPTLPTAVSDAVLKALSKEPGQRFESCSSFIQTIEEAVLRSALSPDSEAAPDSLLKPPLEGQGSLVSGECRNLSVFPSDSAAYGVLQTGQQLLRNFWPALLFAAGMLLILATMVSYMYGHRN